MSNAENAQFGMSRTSGREIERTAHIGQSLLDIFTTPIGSRIQRRDYGSYLFELIDRAMNPAGRLQLTAALVDAANKWEPRARITHAQIDVNKDGQTSLIYQIDTTPDEMQSALLSARTAGGRSAVETRA